MDTTEGQTEKPVPFSVYLKEVFGNARRVDMPTGLFGYRHEGINGMERSFEHLSLDVLLNKLLNLELPDFSRLREDHNGKNPDEEHFYTEMTHISPDPEVIASKQEVFEELLADEGKIKALTDIRRAALQYASVVGHSYAEDYDTCFKETEIRNFKPVKALIELVDSIIGSLIEPQSSWLKQLREFAEGINNDPKYQMVRTFIKRYEEPNNLGLLLNDLLNSLRDRGLNRNAVGSIESNRKFYERYRILDEVTRAIANDPDLEGFLNIETEETGLAEKINKHDLSEIIEEDRKSAIKKLFSFKGNPTKKYLREGSFLTGDLIEYWIRIVKEAIDSRIIVSSLSRLPEKLGFYIAFANHFSRIKSAGYDVCKVEIAPKEEKICAVERGINPTLIYTLPEDVHAVPNDILSTKDQNCFMITGPNNAGKTTYEKQIGLIVAYALMTGHTPARRARISTFDGIFASLTEKDDITRGEGQYAGQLDAFNELDQGPYATDDEDHSNTHITPYSVFLSSEFGTGTAHDESIERTRVVMRYLHAKGVTCYLATHNKEAAEALENEGLPGFLNLALESIPKNGGITLTYKILRGSIGDSHGDILANKQGVTTEALNERLRQEIAAGHFPIEATRL